MTAASSQCSRWTAVLGGLVVGLALVGSGGGAAHAQDAPKNTEIDLTTPVRQELRRLQDRWQEWTSAYFQDDEEGARNALSQLVTAADNLGMSKLPDHSIASAAFAVRSAQEGDYDRARWAVDCARQLDPGRPEDDFASATVERLAGNYPGILTKGLRGYTKLLDLPLEGEIWRQNVGLGLVYVLLISGAAFVVLLMAVRGADLFHDLGRLISPPLPRAGADAAVLALLVLPLVLPSGVFWLAVLWSILLWGYATWSQRAVLVVGWVIVALAPAAVAYSSDEIRGPLVPPIRLLENLESHSLYGSLFLDLEVLRSLEADNDMVTELTADLYRDLDQWEHAREIYDRMRKESAGKPEAASAINNIGVFHHLRGDFGTAVTFFSEAAAADPGLVEAYYNLSRSYYENFNFQEAHEALAEAKRIDSKTVTGWEQEVERPGAVIPTYGGLRKIQAIRPSLEKAGGADESPSLVSRVVGSLPVTVLAVVLAVGLHTVRSRQGYPSSKFTRTASFPGGRWLAALVPGWASTRRGNGPMAFAAVLVLCLLVCVPLLDVWTFHTALGVDVGPGPATILCLAALALFYVLRLARALRGGEEEIHE